MAKRYTKAELDKMPLDARIKAYNRMADEEGAATGQKRYNPGADSLPTDIDSRLSNPAYTSKYPQATGPLRGAMRPVSESEIKAQNAREQRLKAYIAAHPNDPLPADWDKNWKAKGGKPVKKAVGGTGKMRKGMMPEKLAKGGAGKVRKGMMTPEGKIIDVMNKIRGK